MSLFPLLLICYFQTAFTELIKTSLVNRKLCNNDPQDIVPQKCYNSQYSKEVPCDSRRIEASHCLQVNATINDISVEFLRELGTFVDSDISVRRITIDSSQKKATKTLGEMIDAAFLLPRPMWSVITEPFNGSDPVTYVFERYTQLWDPYFEYMRLSQFPSVEVCENSLMMVGKGNCVHPGYSDVRRAYYHEVAESPFISAVYVPALNNGEELGFISHTDCPAEHKNRWTCSFLPMTNCSLPQHVDEGEFSTMGLYNSTRNGGGLVPIGFENLLPRAYKKFPELRNITARIIKITAALPPFVYTSPYTHAANMFRFHGPHEHQLPEFLFMEFLFRKNAFYRRKVADLLARFRSKYNLGNSIRTKDRRFVAVHIRRSDRMGYGANMTEYCYLLQVQEKTGVVQNCTYNNGEIKACKGFSDVFGCNNFGDVPVAAITLDSIIQEAELLIDPTIRNMILFSEDVEWLEKEIKSAETKHPEWKFYLLDAAKDEDPSQGKRFNTRGGGTAAGVFFQATIDLVQECDALLGHFNSGVPMTFAGAMCHHHAGMEGICPPVYNLKNKL